MIPTGLGNNNVVKCVKVDYDKTKTTKVVYNIYFKRILVTLKEAVISY